MAVIVQNNFDKVKQKINNKMLTALEAVGLFVEANAKTKVHVVTGNLRSSITHDVNEQKKSVSVGTNVEYAIKEEFREGEKPGFGTHTFLRPSALEFTEEIQLIINRYMSEVDD